MRRAVGFERPDFHFAETLAAELRFTAEGLLRDEAVRTYRTSVNLIVDEVDKFYHILYADRDPVFERLTSSAVVYLNFTVYLAFGVYNVVLLEQFLYILLGRAVEYGGCDFPAELFADKTQVHFENLPDVHTRGNAEGVQHDLKRGAVRKERHIRLRKDARDDAFVTVASCHLIADLNFTLLRDIYAHEFGYAGGKLVLVFTGEYLNVYDYTALAVGNFQGSIPDLSRFFAEDCAEKSFFGREFGFALRGYFTDENVAGLNFRADADNTVCVQIFKRVLGDVGDIPCNLFRAELSISCFGFVFFDMN